MGYETVNLKEAASLRRSIYQLASTSSVSDAKLKEIIEHAITNVPSSFNSQSTRLVVLVREEHNKFWDIVHDIVKALAPPEAQEKTAARMAMFKGAFGTILFYEDPEPIKKLQSTYAIYSEYFPQWSEHTSAMHQFYLWAALEAEGLGANLQHYNPIANQKTADTFGVPQEWQLKAQLVFGDIADNAREKLQPREQTLPLEKKVAFHGL